MAVFQRGNRQLEVGTDFALAPLMLTNGGALAALRGNHLGSSYVQTIVLASALALGTAVAVKSLSGRINDTLDCTGQKITALGGGAGGCADSAAGGQAPVPINIRLASFETPAAAAVPVRVNAFETGPARNY